MLEDDELDELDSELLLADDDDWLLPVLLLELWAITVDVESLDVLAEDVDIAIVDDEDDEDELLLDVWELELRFSVCRPGRHRM